MKRIGTVVRTAQGKLVVRSDDDTYPALGTSAVDESLDTVGDVVSVFGPVTRPYVAVIADVENSALLVGETLYTRE